MVGGRLIADIQQRKASDTKRSFKASIVSARSSAKAVVTALPVFGQQCSHLLTVALPGY